MLIVTADPKATDDADSDGVVARGMVVSVTDRDAVTVPDDVAVVTDA